MAIFTAFSKGFNAMQEVFCGCDIRDNSKMLPENKHKVKYSNFVHNSNLII